MNYITAGLIGAGIGGAIALLGGFISIFSKEGERWLKIGVGILVLSLLFLAYGLGIITTD